MSFSLIACIGKNNELGKNNDLIFHFKEDMQFFRNTTKNHTVVMGYNTWLSLGEKPLPNRKSLIVTHKTLTNLPAGTAQIPDLDEFIKEHEDDDEEIFIIGGAKIYALFLPHAKTLYLTEVEKEANDADVFFPDYSSLKRVCTLRKIAEFTDENGTKFTIKKYTKRS
ncbi:dihydrofolate reductase [Candidatus Saccharibacteria bacterium]|nr:dihydrofolate reductase [Candidatus Saccharibacteria bacterium]